MVKAHKNVCIFPTGKRDKRDMKGAKECNSELENLVCKQQIVTLESVCLSKHILRVALKTFQYYAGMVRWRVEF